MIIALCLQKLSHWENGLVLYTIHGCCRKDIQDGLTHPIHADGGNLHFIPTGSTRWPSLAASTIDVVLLTIFIIET